MNKYDFPTGRIGNTKNPKLIILLENQNSDPYHFKFNPEYTMKIDKKFKPSNCQNHDENMDFNTVIEYDEWWYEFSKLWNDSDLHIDNNEVLALEYYPYATNQKTKEKEIYDLIWEGNNLYAKESLRINEVILEKALKLEIPIFVYYMSGWYGKGKNNIEPILVKGFSKFVSDYVPYKTVPPLIRMRFTEFISKVHIKKKIKELREYSNFELMND